MRRLRSRRAAEQSRLRVVPLPPEYRMLPAVESTLTALDLSPEFAAIAALARFLAQVMDELEDQRNACRRVAPLLLRVLGELHATPMSRAAQRM